MPAYLLHRTVCSDQTDESANVAVSVTFLPCLMKAGCLWLLALLVFGSVGDVATSPPFLEASLGTRGDNHGNLLSENTRGYRTDKHSFFVYVWTAWLFDTCVFRALTVYGPSPALAVSLGEQCMALGWLKEGYKQLKAKQSSHRFLSKCLGRKLW